MKKAYGVVNETDGIESWVDGEWVVFYTKSNGIATTVSLPRAQAHRLCAGTLENMKEADA